MSFDDRFLDEIRNRLTLSEIIGQRVTLKRAGREHKGCCPFHNEKTPSFTVNDDKQFYHCFGCGAHGDVIGFVMNHDNLSFVEAVEILAGQAGLQIPKMDPVQAKKEQKRKDIYALLEMTATWMQEQLVATKNNDVLEYVTGRGISQESMDVFRIGYAPYDAGELLNLYRENKASENDILETGLFRKSKKNGDLFPFFRERVMFPVTDRRGRIVAFGGRLVPDHMRMPEYGDYKAPKYLNSGDSSFFHKGEMLYAEAIARQAVTDDHSLLVVEGYMDVIACYQYGFQAAVAPLGTAVTEEQILACWRMIVENEKVPIVCFDGDNAGYRAAQRVCERVMPLLKPDHSLSFAFLPEGEDPDSLLKNSGKSAFRNILQQAMPLSEFLWKQEYDGRDYTTPESRAGLEKRLENIVLNIADRDVQYFYRQVFRSKVREAFFRYQKSGKFSKNNNNSRFSANRGQGDSAYLNAELSRPTKNAHVLREKIVLSIIINFPEIFNLYEDDIEGLHFNSADLDNLRQSIISVLSENEAITRDELVNELTKNGFDNDLDNILSDYVYLHAQFAKPGSDFEKVKLGWKETIDFLNKKVRKVAVGS